MRKSKHKISISLCLCLCLTNQPLKCLVSWSVSGYIVHVIHRCSLQSVRSRCHVRRHLAVLALKKILVELPWWKRKYPILFECVTDKLIVITSVSPFHEKCVHRVSGMTGVAKARNEGSYCGNWKWNENCCSRYVGETAISCFWWKYWSKSILLSGTYSR